MSTKPPEKGKKTSQVKESVKKWSKTVMGPGYTIIPAVLLTKQKELGLDAVDVNILLHLACSWWKADSRPYLGKETIAERIGVTPSTVRRHIKKMEKMEVLKRITRTDGANGQRSNYYDLKPLVALLHPLAVQATKEKKARAARRRAEGE